MRWHNTPMMCGKACSASHHAKNGGLQHGHKALALSWPEPFATQNLPVDLKTNPSAKARSAPKRYPTTSKNMRQHCADMDSAHVVNFQIGFNLTLQKNASFSNNAVSLTPLWNQIIKSDLNKTSGHLNQWSFILFKQQLLNTNHEQVQQALAPRGNQKIKCQRFL